jgi:hypothetical protein
VPLGREVLADAPMKVGGFRKVAAELPGLFAIDQCLPGATGGEVGFASLDQAADQPPDQLLPAAVAPKLVAAQQLAGLIQSAVRQGRLGLFYQKDPHGSDSMQR